MKIAVSTDNGQVAQHFGRCSEYTLAVLKDGKLISKETIENPGHQPGFLPQFLAKRDVDLIMAGGMGQKAKRLFSERDIKTLIGVTGDVDEVLSDFARGELSTGQDLCEH